MNGIMVNKGDKVRKIVDNIYIKKKGIYGIEIGVVEKYVLNFVMFGVFDKRIGIGKIFIDCEEWVEGRFEGGKEKV